eukprot:365434-Chlamydomonas_euryale.AAC.2
MCGSHIRVDKRLDVGSCFPPESEPVSAFGRLDPNLDPQYRSALDCGAYIRFWIRGSGVERMAGLHSVDMPRACSRTPTTVPATLRVLAT